MSKSRCKHSKKKDFGDPNELLLRAVEVYPKDSTKVFIRPDKSIDMLAFEDPYGGGTSVERTCDCSVPDRVSDMQSELRGCIVAVTVQDCKRAWVRICPETKNNPCHCELCQLDGSVPLEKRHMDRLAMRAKTLSNSVNYHEGDWASDRMKENEE